MGTDVKPSGFKISQQLRPRQLTFTKTAVNGNQLFFAIFGGTDDHKQTLLVIHAYVAVDAVCPEINIVFA